MSSMPWVDELEQKLYDFKAEQHRLKKATPLLKECLDILRESNWRGDLQEDIIQFLDQFEGQEQ